MASTPNGNVRVCKATTIAKSSITNKANRCDVQLFPFQSHITDNTVDVRAAFAAKDFDLIRHRNWLLNTEKLVKEIEEMDTKFFNTMRNQKYSEFDVDTELVHLHRHSEDKNIWDKLGLLKNAYYQVKELVSHETSTPNGETPENSGENSNNITHDNTVTNQNQEEVEEGVESTHDTSQESIGSNLTRGRPPVSKQKKSDNTTTTITRSPAVNTDNFMANHSTPMARTTPKPTQVRTKSRVVADSTTDIILSLIQKQQAMSEKHQKMIDAQRIQLQEITRRLDEMNIPNTHTSYNQYNRSEHSDYDERRVHTNRSVGNADVTKRVMQKMFPHQYWEDLKKMEHSEFKRHIPAISPFDGNPSDLGRFMDDFCVFYGSNAAMSDGYKLGMLKSLCTGTAALAISQCRAGTTGYEKALKELLALNNLDETMENNLSAELIALQATGTRPEDYVDLYYKIQNILNSMEEKPIHTNQFQFRTEIPRKFSNKVQTRLNRAAEDAQKIFTVSELLARIKNLILYDCQMLKINAIAPAIQHESHDSDDAEHSDHSNEKEEEETQENTSQFFHN